MVADTLKVHINVKGAPANIEHWEHFHGFVDSKAAACATIAQDKNGDGYVDLDETAPVSGTTMVPFNADPAKMDIPTDTYPHASADGSYEYVNMVPLKELEKNFGRIYPGQSINLDKRVVYIHGIPASANLPKSVGSLGTIPAHVTLPIACGVIEKVQ